MVVSSILEKFMVRIPLLNNWGPILNNLNEKAFLDSIVWSPLSEGQYVKEVTDKVQIYIHHTVSDSSPKSVVADWDRTPERVGTHFTIAGPPRLSWHDHTDGQVFQSFNTRYWAYHLGLKAKHLNHIPNAKTSRWLNSRAISIEICSWGGLTYDSDESRFESWTEVPVDEQSVIEYDGGYRGWRYFQKYSNAQLESLRKLLIYCGRKYNIDTSFKGMEIFDIDPRAIQGESGIWTHTSVRPDKSDCHPQQELIQVLGSL